MLANLYSKRTTTSQNSLPSTSENGWLQSLYASELPAFELLFSPHCRLTVERIDPVALAHRRIAHTPSSSTSGPKTRLILIRHEPLTLPYTKEALVISNRIFSRASRMTPTEVLPCCLSFLVLTVSPQMEGLLDPPQASQVLLSAEDLYVAPVRIGDSDVASLEVLDDGHCASAGLGDWVSHGGIAEKSNGEVGEISGPIRGP